MATVMGAQHRQERKGEGAARPSFLLAEAARSECERKGVRSVLCSRSARPQKGLARRPQSKAPHTLVWLGDELGKNKKVRAVEGRSGRIVPLVLAAVVLTAAKRAGKFLLRQLTLVQAARS